MYTKKQQGNCLGGKQQLDNIDLEPRVCGE